jgi:hypothetical protein
LAFLTSPVAAADVSEVIGFPKRCRLATVSGRNLSTGLDLFADTPSKR